MLWSWLLQISFFSDIHCHFSEVLLHCKSSSAAETTSSNFILLLWFIVILNCCFLFCFFFFFCFSLSFSSPCSSSASSSSSSLSASSSSCPYSLLPLLLPPLPLIFLFWLFSFLFFCSSLLHGCLADLLAKVSLLTYPSNKSNKERKNAQIHCKIWARGQCGPLTFATQGCNLLFAK